MRLQKMEGKWASFYKLEHFLKVQSKMCSVHFKDFVSFALNQSYIIVSLPGDDIIFGEYGIKHCLIQMFPEIFSRIIIL